jgi:hypothetical protein
MIWQESCCSNSTLIVTHAAGKSVDMGRVVFNTTFVARSSLSARPYCADSSQINSTTTFRQTKSAHPRQRPNQPPIATLSVALYACCKRASALFGIYFELPRPVLRQPRAARPDGLSVPK